MKQRLDQAVTQQGLVASRSQAESFIRLGKVTVDGKVVMKPGHFVSSDQKLVLDADEQYVGRAGMKLASVSDKLGLLFQGANVLDVGSSTGGFTDYALQHGAAQVVAVDIGTDQLHPSLRGNSQILLYEQTDIRNVRLRSRTKQPGTDLVLLDKAPDIVVIDVSFVSLQDILPAVAALSGPQTRITAMVKPQFEAKVSSLKHKGVIKNGHVRRQILKDLEAWLHRNSFRVMAKADSEVAGSKGNVERFYLLQYTRPSLSK